MHELTGRISNISFSYSTGQPLIAFEFEDRKKALTMVDELLNLEKLTIRVDKFRKRRSLDANAYAWVLISKLAEKTNIRTDEVYRAAIKEIGGNSDTVCVKNEAVKSLCDGWSRNGLGWQTDLLPSKLEGCTNVVLYYGSSCYDVQQMNRLLNILVQDCEQYGIETKSPAEVASLLESWGR